MLINLVMFLPQCQQVYQMMNWNAVLAARETFDLVDFVRIKCPRMMTRDVVRIAAVDL